MKRRTMEVKECLPTTIVCDPQEKFPSETKNQFEATKLYLMTDNDGSEFGIVICPAHQLAIPVEPVHNPGALTRNRSARCACY